MFPYLDQPVLVTETRDSVTISHNFPSLLVAVYSTIYLDFQSIYSLSRPRLFLSRHIRNVFLLVNYSVHILCNTPSAQHN